MENCTEWKLTNCKKRTKKDVVPHKFECQEDRKTSVSQPEQPAASKRKRQQLVAECLDSSPSRSPTFTIVIEEEEENSNPKISEEPSKKSIGVQARIKPPVRSKGTQCNIQPPIVCQNCSCILIFK